MNHKNGRKKVHEHQSACAERLNKTTNCAEMICISDGDGDGGGGGGNKPSMIIKRQIFHSICGMRSGKLFVCEENVIAHRSDYAAIRAIWPRVCGVMWLVFVFHTYASELAPLIFTVCVLVVCWYCRPKTYFMLNAIDLNSANESHTYFNSQSPYHTLNHHHLLPCTRSHTRKWQFGKVVIMQLISPQFYLLLNEPNVY